MMVAWKIFTSRILIVGIFTRKAFTKMELINIIVSKRYGGVPWVLTSDLKKMVLGLSVNARF